jgi:glycosyltransferase involved in cell wall biosynthesis
MRISIVVPAFNEEARLGRTLHTIRAAMSVFDRIGWRSELIVCDNNSSDRTAEIARSAGALVVFEPRNQISRARNTGAAHATGDWLIFIDADSHPDALLFEDVANEIRRGRCLAGGCTVRFERAHPVMRLMTWAWNCSSRVNRWAAGAFIFVNATAFREVGGFDDELYAAEEIDLFRRLKRAARAAGRTITILHRHPLVTSDRKVHLYSWREMIGFMVRTALAPRRTLRSQEQCFTWYDGRR